MLVWHFKALDVSFPFPFPLKTFIKHLPLAEPKPFTRHRTLTKSLTTATSRVYNSSSLETLTSRQKNQIHLYIDTLLDWNKKMNLTAVTSANEVMTRHVEDSLAMIPPLQNSYASHCKASMNNLNIVDVGTGPGLPGLILAIIFPGWKVTLLEAMNKRCVFLEHAVSVTGLTNVEVVRGRAEVMGQNTLFREKFDVAVARAVAEMRVLEYCLPLVRVGGLFLAAKGHDPQEEVGNAERSIQLMGASVLQVSSVESHSPYGQRTVIICTKDRPTPKRYPRDPGGNFSSLGSHSYMIANMSSKKKVACKIVLFGSHAKFNYDA